MFRYAIAMLLLAGGPAHGFDLFVTVDGNDDWTGRTHVQTADGDNGPFATLERARDEIRRMRREKTLPPGGVTVYLGGGMYHRDNAFELTAGDAGLPTRPIAYRSMPNETVIISGGKPIGDFKPVTDESILAKLDPAARDHVLQADLKAQGFDDFGQMRPRGFGRGPQPAGFELFFNDEPMTMSRWPNDDYVGIASVPADTKDRFIAAEDRIARWTDEPDLWMHGYWTHNWADSYVSVESIDPATKEIRTREPHGVYGYKAGGRYYVVNALTEIDTPGEWYLDRDSGMLYFWPPADIADAGVYGSVADGLIDMREASHVRVEGFTLEGCRGTAVKITGGSHATVNACTIRNIGSTAVIVANGTDHTVSGCEVYNIGDGCISMTGGDRKTLAPARHQAIGNHVHDYSRWVFTYTSAVRTTGVGHRIAHNHIHDAPHNAIGINGNEHLIEFNEIHHVCMDTDDAGAFYMGRDWTARGNVIRHNWFHHVGRYKDRFGVQAVYLDDCACGTTIEGNIFTNNVRAVFIGGGRDNVVTNNIFVDNALAVWIDDRAMNWARKLIENKEASWNLPKKLEDVSYRQPPYSVYYPELTDILEDEPGMPHHNVIERNIVVGGAFLDKHMEPKHKDKVRLLVENNLVDVDPAFRDAAKGDFTFGADTPARAIGFTPIPFGQIGP